MDDLKIISALVDLTRSNLSALSRDVGYQRPSLMAALAGRRNLPDAIRPALLQALGVEQGELAQGFVHFWVTGPISSH